MGVYIKDMEMPKDCNNCKFFDDNYDYPTCSVTDNSRGYNWNPRGQRMPDCPIVEVPPHGRLVDESWLKKAMITTLEALKKNPKMDGQEMHLIAAFDTLRAMVEDAPTIIEAEKET